MNGAPLPVEHGAPVRLRVETQLGFKMVKWITAIEFVADVSDIGMGMGGWREDQQFYARRRRHLSCSPDPGPAASLAQRCQPSFHAGRWDLTGGLCRRRAWR